MRKICLTLSLFLIGVVIAQHTHEFTVDRNQFVKYSQSRARRLQCVAPNGVIHHIERVGGLPARLIQGLEQEILRILGDYDGVIRDILNSLDLNCKRFHGAVLDTVKPFQVLPISGYYSGPVITVTNSMSALLRTPTGVSAGLGSNNYSIFLAIKAFNYQDVVRHMRLQVFSPDGRVEFLDPTGCEDEAGYCVKSFEEISMMPFEMSWVAHDVRDGSSVTPFSWFVEICGE